MCIISKCVQYMVKCGIYKSDNFRQLLLYLNFTWQIATRNHKSSSKWEKNLSNEGKILAGKVNIIQTWFSLSLVVWFWFTITIILYCLVSNFNPAKFTKNKTPKHFSWHPFMSIKASNLIRQWHKKCCSIKNSYIMWNFCVKLAPLFTHISWKCQI